MKRLNNWMAIFFTAKEASKIYVLGEDLFSDHAPGGTWIIFVLRSGGTRKNSHHLKGGTGIFLHYT